MREYGKKGLCLFCFFVSLIGPVFAFDFGVQASPFLLIPFGDATVQKLGADEISTYSLGWGATLNPAINFFDRFSVGPEIGYYYMPLNADVDVTCISGGLAASIFAYPLSRMKVQLNASCGVYSAMGTDETSQNLMWKTTAEAGFRFSPMLSLSANAGYVYFNYRKSDRLFTGFTGGLSVRLSLSTEKAAGNVDVTLEQQEPVFPVFYTMYKTGNIGILHITNNESAEIRNVSVSFRAGNYTASLMSCGSAKIIKRRETIDMPLYADFADTIQNFTENGKIPGELVITYELLGEARTTSKNLVVPVYNRNAVRWTDTAVLASYTSPNSPEVLDYAKYAVGIARDKLRTGLNRNMQFAMYLYEGLKVGGISYSHDDSTPYVQYHQDPALLDYIQYPFQTLAYHSGDYDDLGLLYAAALESVGIRTALIPLKNDFVVAFSLGITADDAKNLFNSTDNLLTIADEIWIPVSFSIFREGFINSWYTAMNEMHTAVSDGENINFIILEEAWKTYPAASITASEATFQKPLEDSVVKAVDTDLMRYITTEFGPKIQSVQDTIRAEGGSARLYNQLGLLYVRAGMYDEAKGEYKKAAALQSVAAMINLGNIATLELDYKTAADWYRRALALQPDSKSAQKGLDAALLELEE